MLVPGFTHRPGVHCGSTALADALRVRGVELSEAMVFGLGAGLGFYYLVAPSLSPTHLFQGRSALLERTACEVLGAPARARTADGATQAWEEVRAAVDQGLAPVLETDLAELPYWRSGTHFGGHRIVVAGYDLARGVALVADGDRPGLEEVALDALDRARASIAPPFGAPGRPWLEVDAPASPRPMADAVREALRRQAREMLLDVEGVAGVSALERFAGDLPGWAAAAADEADRAWCFRYGYQVIERRGTGGGLFRALYARFLEEAQDAVPWLPSLGLASRMSALAERWTRLAAAFADLSRAPGAAPPDDVAALARGIARDERRFFEDLAARVP